MFSNHPQNQDQQDEKRKRANQSPSDALDSSVEGVSSPSHRILQLQRQVGNQAVRRMIANKRSPANTIQRYVVLQHQDGMGNDNYTTNQPLVANPVFSSQEQTPTAFNDINNTGTVGLQVGSAQNATPPLRVSDDGNMAVEYLTQAQNEARTFYTNAGVLNASNQRLEDIDSPIRLEVSSGNTIDVPQDPEDPQNGGTRTLQQIGPKAAAMGQNVQQALGNQHECNEVASKIISGASRSNVAVFEGGGEKGTHKMDYQTGGALMSGNDVIPSFFAGTLVNGTGNAQEMSETQGFDRTIDRTVKTQFKNNFATQIANGLITDKGVDLYSAVSTPTDARTEIDTRLGNNENLSDYAVTDILRRYFETRKVMDYARMNPATRSTRSEQTGVNEFAMPDVGEAYGSFTLSTTGLVPWENNRDQAGSIDVQGETALEGQALDQWMDPTHASTMPMIGGFLKVSKNLITNLKSGLWTWHYAAVVAKSGDDRVTMENYNRTTADKDDKTQELDQLWLSLSVTYAHYVDANINNKRNSEEKIKALETKLQQQVGALNGGLQRFTYQDQSPAQADRWYFQMYGSPRKQFQGGLVQDQSFHTEWTQAGGFVNPMTIRTGAAADATFKQGFLTQLNQVLLPNFNKVTLPNTYKTTVRPLIQAVQQATTKVDVSKAFRNALQVGLPALKQVLCQKANNKAQSGGVKNPNVDLVANPNLADATIQLWITRASTLRGLTNWPHKKLGYYMTEQNLTALLNAVQTVDGHIAQYLT